MISLYLQGGLGNQLFQIFAVIAYAIEHQERVVFLEKKEIGSIELDLKKISSNTTCEI